MRAARCSRLVSSSSARWRSAAFVNLPLGVVVSLGAPSSSPASFNITPACRHIVSIGGGDEDCRIVWHQPVPRVRIAAFIPAGFF